MRTCALTATDRLRTATTPDARWFEHLQLWRPDDPDALTTGEGETAVLLLSGTFDLMANGTAWPARGARSTPFAGRPMAIFLPPATEFRTGNGPTDGSGEILLITARQPLVAATSGREALSHKPLLPMAGSGKSFDPTTGEWRPAETFPSAAESLPPRRFERLQVADVTIERVFGESYKAATLCVDEAVIPAGCSLQIRDVPARPDCDEVLVFVRAEQTVRLQHGDRSAELAGDSVHRLSAGEAGEVCIEATAGRCYLVIAYAGKRAR